MRNELVEGLTNWPCYATGERKKTYYKLLKEIYNLSFRGQMEACFAMGKGIISFALPSGISHTGTVREQIQDTRSGYSLGAPKRSTSMGADSHPRNSKGQTKDSRSSYRESRHGLNPGTSRKIR